jgi:hypothetical protein
MAATTPRRDERFSIDGNGRGVAGNVSIGTAQKEGAARLADLQAQQLIQGLSGSALVTVKLRWLREFVAEIQASKQAPPFAMGRYEGADDAEDAVMLQADFDLAMQQLPPQVSTGAGAWAWCVGMAQGAWAWRMHMAHGAWPTLAHDAHVAL